MANPVPIIAQAIEVILRYQPGLTSSELAYRIFGNRDRAADLDKDLAEHLKLKQLRFEGPDDSKRYWPNRKGPSVLNKNSNLRMPLE